MGLTRFPHGVSSFGVPVMGSGGQVPFTTGTYFFVDSVTGSNANDGLDPDHPVATLDYAVGLCTASKGDVIIIMPNHAETYDAAGELDLNVIGITIVGLGYANMRPLITLAGTSLTDVDVDADSITVRNIEWDLTGDDARTATADFVATFDINSTNFRIEGCKFTVNQDTAGAETVFLTDSAASGLKIINNEFHGTATNNASLNVIELNQGEITDIEIGGNIFDLPVSEAFIFSTASLMEYINIHHNTFKQDTANPPTVNIGATAVTNYGTISYNLGGGLEYDTDEYAGKRYAKLMAFENYYVTSSGPGSAILSPVEQTQNT